MAVTGNCRLENTAVATNASKRALEHLHNSGQCCTKGQQGRQVKQCLVLAAGLSSRMGQWKMLLPWGAGSVLDSAIDNALAFCDRVILVTGFRGETLRQRYASYSNILLCHNANYQSGMFSSVQRGVRELIPGHFFMVPGDMPAIAPLIYGALWQQRSTACLVPVSEDGGHGHPVLLPPAMISVIANAAPDSNLKKLILRHGRQSMLISSNGIHHDLDTPQHYQTLYSAYCLSAMAENNF